MAERVLITGGAGFIGSHITDRLLAAGYECRILDSLHPQVHPEGQWPSYLTPEAERIEGDVRDRGCLERALAGVDVVVHQAARVGVGQSQYEIADYLDANVGGTATLLDVLAAHPGRVRKVLVAGSMSSYGEGRYYCDRCHEPVDVGPRSVAALQRQQWDPVCPACETPLQPVPVPETRPLRATSFYALTKKSQEELVLLFGRTYGVPAVALRYFNVYGPRQSLQNPYTGVAAIFLSRVRHHRPPVIYEDGHQLRDFVSVHDIAEANLAALTESGGDGLAINVGTGTPVDIRTVARLAASALHRDLEPQVTGQYRAGDVRHCFAAVDLLAERLRVRAQVSLEDGFAELAAWASSAAAADHFAAAEEELRRRGLL